MRQEQTEDDLYPEDHPAVLASLRALTYGRKSWEAGRDECYAWLDVRQRMDPGGRSNTGHRNICWMKRADRKGPHYLIQVCGPWGVRKTQSAAPPDASEARTSPLLQRAIGKRDALKAILEEEHGPVRPQTTGVADEIRRVLLSTEAGRGYLRKANASPRKFAAKANVAAAYELHEWSPNSSVSAHMCLYKHPRRIELLSGGISCREAVAISQQDPDALPKSFGSRDLIRPVLHRHLRSAIRSGLSPEDVWVMVDDILCDVYAAA